MFNYNKTYYMYTILDEKGQTICCKYLARVAEITKIPLQTLRNHFSKHEKPYKRGEITIYKAIKVYLKAENRGKTGF